MSIKKLSSEAIKEINNTVSQSLSESEINAISKIIEDKLIVVIKESVQSCSNKAVQCCGPDSDIAHKMAKEFKDSQKALIANLNSMR